jgi:hypothetical protein
MTRVFSERIAANGIQGPTLAFKNSAASFLCQELRVIGRQMGFSRY